MVRDRWRLLWERDLTLKALQNISRTMEVSEDQAKSIESKKKQLSGHSVNEVLETSQRYRCGGGVTSRRTKTAQQRNRSVQNAVNWDFLRKFAVQKTLFLILKRKNNIFYVDLSNFGSDIESIDAFGNAKNSLKEVTVTVNNTPTAAITDSALISLFCKAMAFQSNLLTRNYTLAAQANQLKFWENLKQTLFRDY